MDWTKIRAVIFDVDGTLYRQFPVRLHMAIRLAVYCLTHARKVRELLGIYHFRKVREEETFRTSPMEEQIREAARRAGLSDEPRLREAIQAWMFREPLPLIRRYANREILALMNRLQREGRQIVIWSDYAPDEKLAVLNVKPDRIYYPGHNGIDEMKPSEKAARKILQDLGLEPEKTAYLGDRTEKDGQSAAAVGIRFILI